VQLGATFDFVESDTLTTLKSQLFDEETGQPLDLTGGSASLRMKTQRPSDGAWSQPQDRGMTITDQSNGKVEYQFQQGELLAGLMRLEATATMASGRSITTKRYTEFTIRPRL
jgi:hypothetical protein